MIARLTSLVAVSAVVLAAAWGAAAAPGQPAAGRQLTINVQPNPDVAGDPVVIFGRLFGPGNANRTLVLWHRIAGQPRFTPIQNVTTDASGFYDMPRAEGVVKTNRSWYVTAPGVRSRTVFERVQAEVSLQASSVKATTNHVMTFTGRVGPFHGHETVQLQRQVGVQQDSWVTIPGVRARTGGGGRFRIQRRFNVPDTYTMRAVFNGDFRNTGAQSSPVDLVVQQAQNRRFTLNASANPMDAGRSVRLSGVLAGPSNGGQVVTLLAHEAGQPYHPVATTTTGPAGAYGFMQAPPHATAYTVTAPSGRHTAQVFEAVRDVATISVSATRPAVGQAVTFSGTVAPDKAGHSIELQRLGNDGNYHTVQIGLVQPGSVYALAHIVQSPGPKTFRVLITGGPVNAAGHSRPVKLTVQPPPPTA